MFGRSRTSCAGCNEGSAAMSGFGEYHAKDVDLAALALQFSGARFGELVLQHRARTSESVLAAAAAQLGESLPLNDHNLDAWLKDKHSRMVDPEYWARDCGGAFRALCEEARLFIQRKHVSGGRATDEDVFNLVQLVLIAQAYTAHRQPGLKRLIHDACGHGFLRRTFG